MTQRRVNVANISLGAILVGIIILGAVAVYGIASAFPNKVKSFLITFDRFGLTHVGASEQMRIRNINRLQITHEEKQVLINRTVFLNATRDMVSLALGAPVCSYNVAATTENPVSEIWVYYIEGDPKPTLLAFQNNELVNAGKASALDSCK